MVTLGCLHPFQERESVLAGVGTIGVIFIAGECVMRGDFMLDVHTNAFPFLRAQQLEVLDLQILKD
jgi:hypothetical protein